MKFWTFCVAVVGSVGTLVGIAYWSAPPEQEHVRVALIGNSIQYYNDLPRVLEYMGRGKLKQNSCLHGDANLESHLIYGNGMYLKWMTGNARVWNYTDIDLFDFGACTPQQLLLGHDDRLLEWFYYYDDDDNTTEAPQSDDDYDWTKEYELEDDGYNPCLQDENYLQYLQDIYDKEGPPKWDYVVINDNSRSPCCTEQRASSLEVLEKVYLPWIAKTNATLIFLVTFPYWAPSRDMSGLTDIPTFASLNYEGYREYAELSNRYLNKPVRLAPVGLAFLIIWEENPNMWADLMHNDDIHLSPSGTFLEAVIVYATIFGKLPDIEMVVGPLGTDQLWYRARRMAPTEHEMKPFPTESVARYLYHVAHRVIHLGETPKALTHYYNNESAYFTPEDPSY